MDESNSTSCDERIIVRQPPVLIVLIFKWLASTSPGWTDDGGKTRATLPLDAPCFGAVRNSERYEAALYAGCASAGINVKNAYR